MILTLLSLAVYFRICVTSVTELNENFEVSFANGSWLINFYAHWCGYCRSLSPVYDEVGSVLSSISSSIKVGKIDAAIYSRIAKMFRVSEFPTIRFIDGAVSVKYAGDRSARDIVTFALRAHGPAVKTVNTESDFERNATFFSSDPFFVFIGDSDSELKTTYHQIAEQFRLLSWFLSAPRIALPERFSSFVGLNDPLESSLVVFKEDSAIPYPGWSAVPEDDRRQHLTEWILRERFPVFQRFELPGIWEFGSSELSASANRGSTTDSNDLPPYRLIALFLVGASSENAMTTKLLQMGKSLAKRRVPYLTNPTVETHSLLDCTGSVADCFWISRHFSTITLSSRC